MTQPDNFVNIELMETRLIFRPTAYDGSKVRMQKTIRIKIKSSHPESMFLTYTHNKGEQRQQVNIASHSVHWVIRPSKSSTPRGEKLHGQN